MKIFRHICLVLAVAWCAAMILAPLTSAAGTDRGAIQGNDQIRMGNLQAGPGNNQAPGNQGMTGRPGNANQKQDNNQNAAGPGQGNRPGGFGNMTAGTGSPGEGPGNMAGFGNRTMHAPGAGNMTAPQERAAWDTNNATAMGGMNVKRPGFGNETAPSPPAWDAGNSTAMGDMNRQQRGFGNETGWSMRPDGNTGNATSPGDRDSHWAGNASMPAASRQGNGVNQGQQPGQNQQPSDDLITGLFSWLQAQMG